MKNDLTEAEWQSRLEEFNYHCAYCNQPFPERDLEIEHMWPVARGGAHTLQNVVPACKPCNRRKGTLTPLEFFARDHGGLVQLARAA